MFRFLVLAMFLAVSSAFMAPAMPSKMTQSKISMHGGKGFGGGEATRDPEPTVVDPNDPKGKQQAIHKAESFAEYLAKRDGAAATPAPAAAAPAPAPEAAAIPAPAAPAPAAFSPPVAKDEAAAKAAWLAKNSKQVAWTKGTVVRSRSGSSSTFDQFLAGRPERDATQKLY